MVDMVVSAQNSSISTNQHSFLSSVADAVLVGHPYGTSALATLLLSCPRTHNINTMSPTVSLAPLILLVATASGKVHEELSGLNHQPLTSAKEAPFKACIDDSDCTVKGTGFACFQYICYPWADDTAIPKKDRKETCKSNDDCSNDLKCFRHHDRRQIHRGLCMEDITDCSENGRDDCKNADGEGATRAWM